MAIVSYHVKETCKYVTTMVVTYLHVSLNLDGLLAYKVQAIYIYIYEK